MYMLSFGGYCQTAFWSHDVNLYPDQQRVSCPISLLALWILCTPSHSGGPIEWCFDLHPLDNWWSLVLFHTFSDNLVLFFVCNDYSSIVPIFLSCCLVFLFYTHWFKGTLYIMDTNFCQIYIFKIFSVLRLAFLLF